MHITLEDFVLKARDSHIYYGSRISLLTNVCEYLKKAFIPDFTVSSKGRLWIHVI